jgi:hypothetical protein
MYTDGYKVPTHPRSTTVHVSNMKLELEIGCYVLRTGKTGSNANNDVFGSMEFPALAKPYFSRI